MTCSQHSANYFFIEHNDNKYCFSYGQLVAAIIDGVYVEYFGERFHSRTSNKHKAQFRRFYNIPDKKLRDFLE